MYVDLDDFELLQRLDSCRSLERIASYDSQFREGWQIAQGWPRQIDGDRINKVLVLATGGGSAASVTLLQSYLYDRLRVPLVLCQGYIIPAWVDRSTLCVTVSHSGNTEEILTAYDAANERGAQMAVITSGGHLLTLAEEKEQLLIRIPGGMMPRFALGYIFLPLLTLLQRIGLDEDRAAEVKETISLFEELSHSYGVECPLVNNRAKQLALELNGYLPLIYGSLPFTAAVAHRWKNQFAENSKLIALYNSFPALHHDEVAGWDAPGPYLKHFFCILLRDAEDSERISRRITLSVQLLSHRVATVQEVTSRGSGRMARLFSLVYLGDFVSLYLALIRGVDPTPVDIITRFKREMFEGSK